MPQAKAHTPGFYGGSLRQPGVVFEVKEGETGSWFEVIDEDEAKQAKPKAAKPAKGNGPQTFSEIAKQDAKALAPKGAEDLV